MANTRTTNGNGTLKKLGAIIAVLVFVGAIAGLVVDTVNVKGEIKAHDTCVESHWYLQTRIDSATVKADRNEVAITEGFHRVEMKLNETNSKLDRVIEIVEEGR